MTQQQTMCAASQYNVVYTDIFKYCGNLCPKECDSTEYSITTSSSDFPSDEYVKRLLNYTFIKRKYTENSSIELKSNLLSFSIYYSDLKYTEISQSPKYTLSDLISGIGGNLGKRILLKFFYFQQDGLISKLILFKGLFVGASLMSLLEIIDFFMKIWAIIFEAVFKRNPPTGV
jgi:hypothetical protein